jgi:predicted transcriptional regulator
MEIKKALDHLSALSQEGRLELVRLLVKAGPEGLPAGEIASRLGVPANTLSAQLNILSQAGLIEGVRHGRSIIYSVQFSAISGLILFLLEDCCNGQPEVCAPVLDVLKSKACCS